MYHLLLLSKENLKLAKEEALSIANTKNYRLIKNYLILETKKTDFSRLAFTKKVYQILFTTKKNNLSKKIKTFNFNKYYKKDFAVRSNVTSKEKEISSLIYEKLKNPKVNLKNPKTQFEFFFINKTVISCLLLHKILSFEKRRPHLRPGFAPISLHPKLARAVVNLTRIKPKQILLDPFVGTGGILIEAGLINCKLIGSDISKEMLKKCKLNLKNFKLRARLIQEDATKIKVKADAIATDPPYGKASPIKNKSLYTDFLNNAYKILKPKHYLVIITPNIKVKSKFKTIKTIDYYVHKSLTRKIIILQKVT